MGRREAPFPFPVCAVISAGIHSAMFIGLHQAAVQRAPAFDTTPQPLAGDTLEVEPGVMAPDPDDEEESTAATSTPTEGATTKATAKTTASGRRNHMRVAASDPVDADAGAGPPAVFGAAGVRFATDLATTFTRAFPQAASAEPLWTSITLGEAGAADVTLTLDEEGRVSGTAIGGAPSPALRKSIERTLVLLAPRAFTAHAPVTKIHVRAQVMRDTVHDGLHGDVFALSGGSFSGDVGNAFFALPSPTGNGRRVDVTVRLVAP